ncbi:MAG: hypothetical protein CM15mP49_16560 [Actinomycetota bacterium]|nr:MAG: hypothetical protein CM15mP49_16560 [Actinomycetota bacterium]
MEITFREIFAFFLGDNYRFASYEGRLITSTIAGFFKAFFVIVIGDLGQNFRLPILIFWCSRQPPKSAGCGWIHFLGLVHLHYKVRGFPLPIAMLFGLRLRIIGIVIAIPAIRIRGPTSGSDARRARWGSLKSLWQMNL